MSATAMRLDLESCRTRTRWTMATSAALHALLLLLWVLWGAGPSTGPQPITEITLLEPGDLAPASAATTPVPESRLVAGLAAPPRSDLHFRRDARAAELAPEPQSDATLSDRLNARLEALQSTASVPKPGGTAPIPSSLWGTSPAVTPGPGTGGASALPLRRGGLGTGPPLELSRGNGHWSAPALVPAGLPSARSATANAPTGVGDAATRQMLAGASLAGPIADRPVLEHPMPLYPDWAKREGVEGSVTLHFVVRADGGVKENVLVQKTAGFGDFDESARTALRAWRFEPLHGGRTGEQWGTITFHFRLRDSG